MQFGDVASGELLRKLQTRKGRNLIGTVKLNGGEILLHQDDPLIDRLFSKEIQQKFSEIGRLAKNDLAIRQEAEDIARKSRCISRASIYGRKDIIWRWIYLPEDLAIAMHFIEHRPMKTKFRDAMTDEKTSSFLYHMITGHHHCQPKK